MIINLQNQDWYFIAFVFIVLCCGIVAFLFFGVVWLFIAIAIVLIASLAVIIQILRTNNLPLYE